MPEVIEEGRVWRIRAPDDMHCHFRDLAASPEVPEQDFGGDPFNRLPLVIGYTACQFARAIAMPNTKRPIVSGPMAEMYAMRIRSAATEAGFPNFEPLMTIYVTHDTSPSVIIEARQKGVLAGKFYPKHGTTGSGNGIHDFLAPEICEVYKAMEECGMLALFHGASPDPDEDVFEREHAFLETFQQIHDRFPQLRLVFEHVSTALAAETVKKMGDTVFATVTPQHLLATRNDLLAGPKGLKPSLYCMPILQTEDDRQVLVDAVVSGSRKFFAGTDSAPHLGEQKYCEGGAMGCFNATHAMEHYAFVFEQNAGPGWLAKLERFTSENGAYAYGIALNQGTLLLRRTQSEIPKLIEAPGGGIVPFRAGEKIGFEAKIDL